MLQAIRDKAQGWIAWLIVILISIPFALWGIQEYFGVGAEPVVAKVNGQDILQRDFDRRVNDFRETLRASLGAAYRPDLIDEAKLRQQVKEQMIDERVLLDVSANWGMRAGDDLVQSFIRSFPGFQQDGRFNQDLYKVGLRNRGMSPAMFWQLVRQDILLNQIKQAVRNSSITTQREVAETVRLQQQKRGVSYVSIAAKKFLSKAPVAEEALKAFYEETSAQYMVPEKVSLQYLLLDVDALSKTIPVDDEKLKGYFEQHLYEFRVPEQRRLRHILIGLTPGADEKTTDAALKKLKTAQDRLAAGEDFTAVAKALSDDPGSAQKGGDLGFVERGDMVKPFEEAAFALKPGTVSKPVLTKFGYHLIEVTDIKAGGDAQFDDVRDEVESAYRKAEAENLFYDYSERLGELSFENPGSLEPAAQQLGLKLQKTEPFARNAPPPVMQNPKALNAAFSEEVLAKGNNSDLLDLGPNRAMVLRVLDHQDAHRKPFAEVREQVEAAYRLSKAKEMARKAGEKLLAELRTGGEFDDLAHKGGWTVEKIDGLTRNEVDVPRELVESAFGLLPPDADHPVRYGTAQLPDSFAVLRLDQVTDGNVKALSDKERSAVQNQVRAATMQGDFEELLGALRESADIRRSP